MPPSSTSFGGVSRTSLSAPAGYALGVSTIGETDGGTIAWLATSTVLGSLLSMPATGDRQAATQTVYEAADQIAYMATGLRKSAS